MDARFLWLSDLHLDRIPFRFREGALSKFIRASNVRDVVVTGDITTGRRLEDDLVWLSRAHPRHRFHVVMGNHDYYGLSFRDAHRLVSDVTVRYRNINWLSITNVTALSSNVALVGDDGWFCTTAGIRPWWLWFSWDSFLIAELKLAKKTSMDSFIELCRQRAAESVVRLVSKIERALQRYDTVVVATHFPPWGKATDNDGYVGARWVNYDSNALLGDALVDLAANNPEKKFVVLAGHTHVPKSLKLRANLSCFVAPRTVGSIVLESVLQF